MFCSLAIDLKDMSLWFFKKLIFCIWAIVNFLSYPLSLRQLKGKVLTGVLAMVFSNFMLGRLASEVLHFYFAINNTDCHGCGFIIKLNAIDNSLASFPV